MDHLSTLWLPAWSSKIMQTKRRNKRPLTREAVAKETNVERTILQLPSLTFNLLKTEASEPLFPNAYPVHWRQTPLIDTIRFILGIWTVWCTGDYSDAFTRNARGLEGNGRGRACRGTRIRAARPALGCGTFSDRLPPILGRYAISDITFATPSRAVTPCPVPLCCTVTNAASHNIIVRVPLPRFS